MTVAQNLYFLLKEGYTFPNACYRLGLTPQQGSELVHGGRKKKPKQEEKIQKVNTTFCINRVCKSCSDESCLFRTEEQD